MSTDFVDSLKKINYNNYLVSIKAPSRIPLLKYAKNEDTRYKMVKISSSVCMTQNNDTFIEILNERDKLAKLLNFKNHGN